jgi:hypothetical protein
VVTDLVGDAEESRRVLDDGGVAALVVDDDGESGREESSLQSHGRGGVWSVVAKADFSC